MSGLVPQTESHLPGSGGRGRGTERVEDTAGPGERAIDDIHLLLFVIIVIVYYYLSLFTAGPDPEARPAVVLAVGRLEGPDDGAEETQAETRSVLTVRNVFLTVFTLPGLLNSAPSLINIGERH